MLLVPPPAYTSTVRLCQVEHDALTLSGKTLNMSDLEKGEKGSLSSTAEKVSRPVTKQRSNCVLGFCRLVNFLTVICALLCAVAHGMALMVGEGSVQAGTPT